MIKKRDRKVFLVGKIEFYLRHFFRVYSFFKIGVKRKKGITACMSVLDEKLSVESFESIYPYVDEVIIVDAGRDEKLINKTKRFDNVVYVFSEPSHDRQFQIALAYSRYSWLLRWDADFIGDKNELHRLVDLVNELSEKGGYYAIKCSVDNGYALQKEPYVFSYHPDIFAGRTMWLHKFKSWLQSIRHGIGGHVCYGVLPIYYFYYDSDIIFALHKHESKSDSRKNMRLALAKWSEIGYYNDCFYADFDEFYKDFSEERYGIRE